MYYTQARADWLATSLVRSRLYRGIRAGLLTLGHIRTMEMLENPLATVGTADRISAAAIGQTVAASLIPWRTFLRRVSRASVWFSMSVRRCEPRTEDEADAFFAWWKEQTFAPPQTHQTAEAQRAAALAAARSDDHAATPAMRTAAALASVPGWDRILGIRTPWDATLIAADHLLLASAENAGACHFSADLMEG